MYGLREKDEKVVAEVLADVRKSVTCEIGIGGSLAQRAISPEIAAQLEGKPLHDMDLLLIHPGKQQPTLPVIHTYFQVKEKAVYEGWYFGLTHRKTGTWVDLFTPHYERSRKLILLAGIEYQAESIESQILYLAQNILWRAQTHNSVRKKWQKKLRILMNLPGIDTSAIEAEYAVHRDYFEPVLPEGVGMPAAWRDYCMLALAQHSTPLLKDALRAIVWYFWTRKRYMDTETLPEAMV